MSRLERIPQPTAHRRQVLVVHRDRLIQQGLLGFRQETDYQSIPLGRCEPLEVIRIVAPRQLGQFLNQDRADAGQVNLTDSQGAQPIQPVEMGKNGRSVGFGRVLLELEQFRPAIPLRHLDEAIDRGPDLRRQPVSDPIDDALAAAGCAGGDDPFEGRGRREEDLPRAEQCFGTTEDLGNRVALLREGLNLPLKPFLGGRLERSEPEVLSDAMLVLEVGGFAPGRVDEQDGREVKLAAEVVCDPNAHGLVIGQETPVGSAGCRAGSRSSNGDDRSGTEGSRPCRHWTGSSLEPAPHRWDPSGSAIGLRRCRGVRIDGLARGSSTVDIEAAPLKVLRQVVDRGPGVEGGGVERLVAQQAGQLHELPGVLSQVVQREGMPERVG